MKRILAVITCVALCLAGCSFSTFPTPESTIFPTANPSTIPFAESSTATPVVAVAASPIPVAMATASERGFTGEWAGYLGNDNAYYALDWEWAAKLNIREQDVWLSLDRIDHEKDTWDLPFLKPVAENAGARLEIISRNDESIVLSILEYAYHTGDEPPFPVGTRLTLSYKPVTNEQERDALTVSKNLTPSYTGSYNDVFEGALATIEGNKLCTAAFAHLPLPDVDSLAYPRWNKELNNLSLGVRGAYSFGETGGDNDNSSYIFVYADEQGYEHIRMTFCWILGTARQDTSTAFVVTEPVFEFGLSMAGVPYWNTLYELDAATGEFIDVSVKYTDYYRDVYIPRINWFLSGGKPDVSADRETQVSYEAQEEMLRRALTITEGERPRELPPVPAPEPNAPSIKADIYGNGVPVLIEPYFFTIFRRNAPNYDAVRLRVNGEWAYSYMYDDTIEAKLHAVDLDEETPGVELAFQLHDHTGAPYVYLEGHLSEGKNYRSAEPLWGTLPAGEGELAISIPGDGTVCGVKRSALDPDILHKISYAANEYGNLRVVETELTDSMLSLPIMNHDDAIKRLNLSEHLTLHMTAHGDFVGDGELDIAVLYSKNGDRKSDVEGFAVAIIDGGSGSVYQTEIFTSFFIFPSIYAVKGPNGKEAILASFDSGGTGGDMLFFILDAANGQFVDLFHQASREIHPDGVLIDGFKGSVHIGSTGQTFVFSVEGNKDDYTSHKAWIYKEDGTLLSKDYQISFDDISRMQHEVIDGKQTFICTQYGYVWGHTDVVCAVHSRYGYDADGEIALEKVWLESLAEAR